MPHDHSHRPHRDQRGLREHEDPERPTGEGPRRAPHARGVTDWWGPATGSADLGGTFEVSFENRKQVIVLHVEPGQEGRVVWSVVATPLTPEWVGTRIVFDVAASGDGTVLHFRHHGLTPELQCFDMCHAGSTHYLGSLVSYVDTGEGRPSRNETA